MAERSSKDLIIGDILGGLSLAGLLVPEAIAYSAIAGLPPSFGIIGAVVGPFAYAILGRSRLAVVSATSSAAALLSAAIASASIPNVPRADSAIALVALVGFFFLIGAAFRLASLTSFISRAVLRGFGFGLALTISIRQLPSLLGLEDAHGSIFGTLGTILAHFSDVHRPSLLLGVGALLFLGFSRRLKFAPAGLVLIIVTTIAMRFGPASHLGISTAGIIAIPALIPHVPAIAGKDWLRLGQFAFPIAIVILAESWATIRSLAAARGELVYPSREIAALGLANLASALLHGLPVGAGFSIGNASEQAGTRSKAGALFAASAVAILVLTSANWLALIPEPVLAAIVISALMHALSPRPIISLFRLGKDQWVAVSAALGVLLLGITNGLLIAVGLSVLGLLRRLAVPKLSELGRIGAHDFVDRATHPEAKSISGILVIRPDAPLFFGNADSVLRDITTRAEAARAQKIVLSLEETDDLDSSTLEALSEFNEAMGAQSRSLILARVHDRVRKVLELGGLAELAATSTFSVDDAVQLAAAK